MDLTLLALTTQAAVGVILSVLCVIMILAVIKAQHVFELRRMSESDKAGAEGEQAAAELIAGLLAPGDRMFTNLVVNYNGKRTELDNVIVNNNGAFIIEVKNYSGELVGGVDDFEWTKYHKSAAGITYQKTVKNPIKQVRRQVYILAGLLRESGINVRVRGYALFLQHNCPVESQFVLESIEDIDQLLHGKHRSRINDKTVEAIADCLEHLPEYVYS